MDYNKDIEWIDHERTTGKSTLPRPDGYYRGLDDRGPLQGVWIMGCTRLRHVVPCSRL